MPRAAVPVRRVPFRGNASGPGGARAPRRPASGLRVALLVHLVTCGLLVSTLLRTTVFVAFHEGGFELGALLPCLAIGLGLDGLTAGVLCLPLALPLVLAPHGWLARRWLRAAGSSLFLAGAVFLAVAEYFFFEEFQARFNHVALDYLMYPTEVFTNLAESYDVPLFVALALLVGAVVAVWGERRLARFPPVRLALGVRFWALGRSAIVSLVALVVLWGLPWELRSDRVEDEVAHNGLLALVHAFATGKVDYARYYLSMPPVEAHSRAVAMLGEPPARDPGLQRAFVPRASTVAPPEQVIVILEESFGSEFVGVLGHPELGLTPHFDRWSREGLLLTELVPTGNRTVRGMEAVLASFVPLPGDAILHRDRSEDVATLARVYRARGFRTAFLYGGRLSFDGMASFLEQNGWDELVQRPQFPEGAYQTAWGVADEFALDELLARQRAALARSERFFATLLTVSNHRPYDVPLDDAHVRSTRKGRYRAVAYADACLGRYLDGARAAGLLEHALILIVGDHGARVYGSADIPAGSYRVPALFLSPDPHWRGRTLERLCSQIDLAPTLLSLSGLSVEAPFFGQDVLDLPPAGGRAFLQHNRDVGLLTDTELIVLGLHQTVRFHVRSDKHSDDFRRLEEFEVTAAQRERARDAAAVFQTAEELYEARAYRLPEEGAGDP